MNPNNKQAYVITTASGKGGVGKSIVSVNLAETLTKLGHRVAIIDADLGMSNCATLLNESIPGSAKDVVDGSLSVADIIHQTQSGLKIVTGSDIAGIEHTSIYPVLDEVLLQLQNECDYILIDTPAGTSELSLWALDRSNLCTLIVADEPTVISDAYRFCKFVLEIDPDYPFGIAVNFADDAGNARDVANRFNMIVQHFLNRQLPFFGYVPIDERVRKSVHRQKPFVHDPELSELHRPLEEMAGEIIQHSKYSLINHQN